MELDRVPLWRGDHVAIKQLVEDFARYLYLPRLKDSSVLLGAIRDGLALLTWEQDAFAFADSFDETAGRYRGLRGGQHVPLADARCAGAAGEAGGRAQADGGREASKPPAGGPPVGPIAGGEGPTTPGPGAGPTGTPDAPPAAPSRSASTARSPSTPPASAATPAASPTR